MAEDPFVAAKPGETSIGLDLKHGRLLAPVPGLYEYILQHSVQQQPGLEALDALQKVGDPLMPACSELLPCGTIPFTNSGAEAFTLFRRAEGS